MSNGPIAEGGTGQPTTGQGGLSVPLGVHLSEMAEERTKRFEREIAHTREIADLHRTDDQAAIEKALNAAKELAEKHNDLIRSGEKKDETYATKTDLGRLENWQAKMNGGLVVVAVIGVANFVKLWVS